MFKTGNEIVIYSHVHTHVRACVRREILKIYNNIYPLIGGYYYILFFLKQKTKEKESKKEEHTTMNVCLNFCGTHWQELPRPLFPV